MNERIRRHPIRAACDFLGRHRSRFLEGFVAGIIVIVLASGIYTVKQEEAAVVTRFGKVVKPDVGPGVRYRMPVIDRAYVHPTNRIVRYEVSGDQGGNINLTIRSAGFSPLEVDLALQLKVDNLKNYLFASTDPRRLVTVLVQEELAGLIGRNVMAHPLLGSSRGIIQRHLFDTVTSHLESHDIGIELLTLEILDVRAVEETLYVFRDIEDPVADRARGIG
jgi:regulator of protease activity HflC (stomatin/prohibitin superfamily)